MCSFYGAVLRYYGLFYMIPLFLSVFHRVHCVNDWFEFSWPLKNSITQSPAVEPNQKCQNFGKSALLKMLKDEGNYNPSYMASTKEEAANFPDLANKDLIRAAENRFCDAECKQKTDSFFQLLQVYGNVPDGNKIYRPDTSNKEEAKKINPSTLNFATMFFNQNRNYNHRNQNLSPTWGFNSGFGGRSKRQANKINRYKPKNDLDSIGSSYSIYCWKEGDEDENEIGLFRLCRACKSIREMPEEYFPTYLNEVRCDGSSCLANHGTCVQKYVTLDILKNNGTYQCQQWVKVSVSISVCCDCQLKAESPLISWIKHKS